MIIRKKDIESKWFKYKGGLEFQIRPFKSSEHVFGSNRDIVKLKFVYCLVDWKGLTDDDGKTPYKCTKENKEYLYDYYEEVSVFVIEKLVELQTNLDNAIKN